MSTVIRSKMSTVIIPKIMRSSNNNNYLPSAPSAAPLQSIQLWIWVKMMTMMRKMMMKTMMMKTVGLAGLAG
jgi:hypothetical protein